MNVLRKIFAILIVIIVLAAIVVAFEWGSSLNPFKAKESQAVAASFNNNDFTGALSQIDSQLNQNPNDADLLIQKASVLAQQGSLQFKEQEYGQQAIQLAQQALAIKPKSDEAWRIIGYANEIMQNYPAAHDAYQKSLALNPDNTYTISQEAHAYDLEGDLQKAEAGYRKAYDLNPNLDQASAGLARIDVTEGDYADALNLFEQTAQNTQNNRLKAEALYSAGTILGAQGDHAQAQLLMQTATVADPSYSLGFVGLGIEQFALANATSSQLALEARLALVSDSLSSLDHATELNPKQVVALFQLGFEYAATGQRDNALQTLDQAKRMIPDDITLNAVDKQRMTDRIDEIVKVINARKHP